MWNKPTIADRQNNLNEPKKKKIKKKKKHTEKNKPSQHH